MRALLPALSFTLVASVACADLDPDVEDRRPDDVPLTTVEVPCLLDRKERRYIVTWWIEDKKTGERRDPGSQEVRRRC